MPEDLKLLQIGSSLEKNCQIIFACYFQKLSISIRAMGCGTASTAIVSMKKSLSKHKRNSRNSRVDWTRIKFP